MAQSREEKMHRLDVPKIQMPAGSPDVLRGPEPDPVAEADARAAAKGMAAKTNRAARRGKSRKPLISSRMAVWMGTLAFTLLWIGGVGAYTWSYYGDRLLNQPPATMVALGLGVLVPAALALLLALIITRSMRLNDQAMRLAALSRELIDPGNTAANDVAKLGAIIRKELEGLNREIDGAVSRVGALEGRLQQQTTMISDTSRRLDKRTDDITARLSDGREKVDAASRTLTEEAKRINETLDMQNHALKRASAEAADNLRQAEETLADRTRSMTDAISVSAESAQIRLGETQDALREQLASLTGGVEGAAEAARGKLAESEQVLRDQAAAIGKAVIGATESARAQLAQSSRDLGSRTQALGQMVAEAGEMARNIAEDIERETGKLEAVSTHARSRAEAITSRFTDQHKALTALVDRLADEQSRLDTGLEQQGRLLTQMSDGVSDQIRNIEDAIEAAAANFQRAVEEARAGAERAGEGFDQQARTLSNAAEASTSRLTATTEAVKALSHEARDQIDEQLRASQNVLEQHAKAAREALSAQSKDAVAAFETALEELHSRMAALGNDRTSELAERASELETALREGEARMRELSERLDNSIRGVHEGTDDVNRRLAESADAFEARMAQFPAHAEDAVRQVREHINSQIGSLAKLADQAAERAQMLAKAAETPAPAVSPAPYEKAAVPSDTLTPRQRDNGAQKDYRTHRDMSPDAATPPPAPLSGAIDDARADAASDEDNAPLQQIPDLPGRDVYPQVWDGMEEGWRNQRGRMGARPRLGTFDDVAKSLVSRLRPGSGKAERPTAEVLRSTITTSDLQKVEPDDISDFRIVRRAPEAPQQKAPDPKPDTPAPHAEPRAETKPAPEPVYAPETKTVSTLRAPSKPVYRERGWKEILQNVDNQEAERRNAAPQNNGEEASFQRNALLIIEKLQAMSIDIDRALEDEPPTDLLDRYMNGERNVFARRLSTFTGPDMLERIARKFREDAEFHNDVTRYIEAFEELLKAARGRDRENILIETYLTSQTGKVYMILGSATGHLK